MIKVHKVSLNNMSDFREGDEVMIGIKDVEVIEQMQLNHGGWNDKMTECIEGLCKLIQVFGPDAVVKAPSGAHYRINPELLTKYISNEYKPGSEMIIISKEDEMKRLQVGHGGWSDGMKDLLGKPVEIVQKMPDGDYKIKVNGRSWTINPNCFDLQNSVLEKKLSVGEKVTIIIDKSVVMNYQKEHGGWSELMTLMLGEEVDVVEVLENGDYFIEKYGMKWKMNKMCFKSEIMEKENNKNKFCKGDSVKISESVDYAKELQKFHGGWVSSMQPVLGKVGTVEMILPTGDLKVRVNGLSFVFNRQLLTKVEGIKGEVSDTVFKVGDKVKVLKKKNKVKQLQKDHGEWIDSMKLILGEKGKVVSIFPDGDLRVKIMGNSITLNPACVKKVDAENDSDSDVPDFMKMMGQMAKMFSQDDSDDSDKSDSEKKPSNMDKELSNILQVEEMKFFAAIKSGDIEQAKAFVSLVGPNISMQKLFPLMVAVSEGHKDIAELLLDHGADINAKDKDGDTALHICVQKNRTEICNLLVSKDVNVNEKNKLEITAIMLAADLGTLDILRCLVKAPGADLNLGGKDKDTALHVAIQKSRLDSVEILLEAGADLMILNEKQFSSYHMAAMRGHEKILETFLMKVGPSIVDLQKEDKFAAIHLVALNNHPGCLKLLIKYNADINIRNVKLQTALHIAVSQRYLECVKILVENKAEINLKDESGDTPMHDAIRAQSMEKLRSMSSFFGMSDMFKLMKSMQTGSDRPEDIVMYLAKMGARLDIKNNNGNTAITACDNTSLKAKLINIKDGADPEPSPKIIVELNRDSKSELEQLKLKIMTLEDENICMICRDRKINCTFKCGHVSCNVCANNLYECHICRTSIEEIIKIYR